MRFICWLLKEFLGICNVPLTMLFYKKKGGTSELIRFIDSDFAGDKEDRKNTSAYMFMLGFKVVSWCSKKQPIVTLSTTEAKFVAATVCYPSNFVEEDIG